MLGTIGRIWLWRLSLYTVADEHGLDLFLLLFIVDAYNNNNNKCQVFWLFEVLFVGI